MSIIGRYTVGATVPLQVQTVGWPFPMLLTNASTDSTIYLGNDTSVTTSNGTPLAPGANVMWEPSIPLYVITAVGRTANLLILSGARDMFNPYAIAQAINLIGVPTFNEFTLLGSSTGLATGVTTAAIDISRYATIVVLINSRSNLTYNASVMLSFDNGELTRDLYCSCVGLLTGRLNTAVVPAIGESLTLTNNHAPNVGYSVYGSLRDFPPSVRSLSFSNAGGNMQASGDGGLSTSGATNINAGATVDFYLGNTYDIPMTIVTQKPGGLAVSAEYFLYAAGAFAGSTPIFYRKTWLPAAGANETEVITIEAPAAPLVMRCTNNDGAVRQFRFATTQSPTGKLGV